MSKPIGSYSAGLIARYSVRVNNIANLFAEASKMVASVMLIDELGAYEERPARVSACQIVVDRRAYRRDTGLPVRRKRPPHGYLLVRAWRSSVTDRWSILRPDPQDVAQLALSCPYSDSVRAVWLETLTARKKAGNG